MGKRRIILITLLLAVVVGLIIWLFFFRKPAQTPEDTGDPKERDYRSVREAKMDIVVIGEDPCFEYEIPFRRITDISEDSLKCRSNYRQLVIVIVDRADELKLTKEEIALIDKCIYKDKAFMIYVGQQYGSAWEHKGEEGSYDMAVGNRGIAYTYEKGILIKTVNFWSVSHEEIYKTQPGELGLSIIEVLVWNLLGNA